MRIFQIAATLFLMSTAVVQAQDFGLSFSYFLPRHGEFSTPISPFSVRGVGVDLNRYIAIETGGSLYRMTGMNLKNLPFESKKALLGPNFTVLVPLELVLQLKGTKAELDIKGGGFFFCGFDQRINYGNLDRSLRTAYSRDVGNADADFKNNPGYGYHGGAELTVWVNRQVGVSLETNYFVGQAKFPLTGTFLTGTDAGLETIDFNFADAQVDFTGLEFSIGLIFSSGGGAPAPKAKKRRR